MPFTPAPATSTPPSVYWQRIDIALVIVTPPKPPGSRQLISPPGAVFEMAPAKVLHGAVRLHGLASSPTPDTHVRLAWALAREAKAKVKRAAARSLEAGRKVFICDRISFLDRSTCCIVGDT